MDQLATHERNLEAKRRRIQRIKDNLTIEQQELEAMESQVEAWKTIADRKPMTEALETK